MDDAGAEAGVVDDLPEPESGPTPTSNEDASVDVIVRAKTAYEATPAPAEGPACGPMSAAIEPDGQVVGLDRDGSRPAKLQGKDVTACVGVEFDPSATLGTIRVHAGPKGQACNRACSSDECNTGDYFYVFAGPSRTSLVFLKEVVMAPKSPISVYNAAIPASLNVTTAVVCRSSAAPTRDDIVVDAIDALRR